MALPWDDASIEHLALQAEKVFAQQMISSEVFANLSVTCVPDYFFEEMGARLRVMLKATVLGEQLDRIEYPLDWWEAFKERWFPAFLVARYPVRRRVWNVCAIYPALAIREGVKPVLTIYKGFDNSHMPFSPRRTI